MILRDLASVMDILKDLKPCALKVKQKHMCCALPGELIDCEMPAFIPAYSIAERGGEIHKLGFTLDDKVFSSMKDLLPVANFTPPQPRYLHYQHGV